MNEKKCVLFATLTANGFIADSKGQEDIFSNDNWDLFVDYALKYKNIIWGRKTYEMVCEWGEGYIDCFDSIKIIVLSESNINPKKDNVIVCNSIHDVMGKLKINNIDTPYIGGGTSIYSLFLKENLVNKIIISYNSIFVSNGKTLFAGEFELKNYKISNITPINDYIVCIEMNK